MNNHNPRLKAVAIVDEEVGRLALLVRFVEQAGYLAMPAREGRKAFMLLSSVRPEVAVIHASLKTGMAAFDLCKQINGPLADDGYSRVSIIVIAPAEETWFSSGENAFIDDYLILPFAAHQLLQAIDRLTRQQDRGRDASTDLVS